VFVNHLADRVFQEHDELVERLDLPLQLDSVHEEDGNWNSFLSQGVEERVL
jgi:hypothetical protein